MKIQCWHCTKFFEEDSEKYYWHLKIYNAQIEKDILEKQWDKVNELEAKRKES